MAGADGCPELHLHTNGIGRHRRSRLPIPHLRHVRDSLEACPQHVHARRAEGAPAAPGDNKGAITTAEAQSGDSGGTRGGGAGNPRGQRRRGAAGLCSDGGGASAEPLPPQTYSGDQVDRKNIHTKKIGTWTDLSLENALNSITDDGMSIREVSKLYGIPTSSIKDHLYGRTTSRQKGIRLVFTPKKIVDYEFKIQDRGHPLTAVELCLKMAIATQTRSTPWSARGVLGKGWLRRFWSRHPKISSRRSQGLEVARARALCPITAESLYANLERLYTTHSYPPTHIWDCDKSSVQAGRA